MCARGSIPQANNHCFSPDGGVYPTQQKSSCLFGARAVGGGSLCVRARECVHMCVCGTCGKYWTVTYWESSGALASHREGGEEAKLDWDFWYHQSAPDNCVNTHLQSLVALKNWQCHCLRVSVWSTQLCRRFYFCHDWWKESWTTNHGLWFYLGTERMTVAPTKNFAYINVITFNLLTVMSHCKWELNQHDPLYQLNHSCRGVKWLLSCSVSSNK